MLGLSSRQKAVDLFSLTLAEANLVAASRLPRVCNVYDIKIQNRFMHHAHVS